MTDKKHLNFENTEQAYKHLTWTQLCRAYALFKVIQVESLTTLGTGLVKSLMKLHMPVNWVIKPTVFKHFVGGETILDCEPIITSQAQSNMKTILDLSLEGLADEDSFENALAMLKETVDRAATQTTDIPFAVFKPSAIGDIAIIEKKQAESPLSTDEHVQFEMFCQRFQNLCRYAYEKRVPILIDAEETYIQSIFDELALDMQRELNKKKPYIFNTFQLYRHDKLEHLRETIALARAEGFHLGVKIVRGAYMEKERSYAEKLKKPCLIQPDKNATDTAYDSAIDLCLENTDIVSVVIGSHNESSTLRAAEKIAQLPEKEKSNVFFSQLFGMADHISYNLAAQDYLVAKYVPYGPVKDVLPYLFRRAEENSSVQGQSHRELDLLGKEIQRRRSL